MICFCHRAAKNYVLNLLSSRYLYTTGHSWTMISGYLAYTALFVSW
jgi:hypothetical protein